MRMFVVLCVCVVRKTTSTWSTLSADNRYWLPAANIGTGKNWDFFALMLFLKNRPHRTTSKNGTVRHHPPWRISANSWPIIIISKIPSIRNTCQDSACNMVERPGTVLRVEFCRGTLLHNECTMAIFFGGGCNNHPIEFQGKWKLFGFSFSIFRLNIFECAVVVFWWCGGGQKWIQLNGKQS